MRKVRNSDNKKSTKVKIEHVPRIRGVVIGSAKPSNNDKLLLAQRRNGHRLSLGVSKDIAAVVLDQEKKDALKAVLTLERARNQNLLKKYEAFIVD